MLSVVLSGSGNVCSILSDVRIAETGQRCPYVCRKNSNVAGKAPHLKRTKLNKGSGVSEPLVNTCSAWSKFRSTYIGLNRQLNILLEVGTHSNKS